MSHYYNEHNPYRAGLLRERMAEGLLPEGIVDERDIEKIPDADWHGHTQVHLFAGIGGFPLGLRRAGFSENIRIVTGGFPCQDISNAGKRAGITGARSGLWREMVRCIRVVQPEFVFVENVAALLGRGMGVVLGDLAAIGYDAEGDCISAADVGAPHLRKRIWIVAYPRSKQYESRGPAKQRAGAEKFSLSHCAEARNGRLPIFERRSHETNTHANGRGAVVADATQRRFAECGSTPQQKRRAVGQPEFGGEIVSNTTEQRLARPDFEEMGDTGKGRQYAEAAGSSRWPVEPNVGRVAYGIPRRVDRLAALGDAIVPQCVEEVIRRFYR